MKEGGTEPQQKEFATGSPIKMMRELDEDETKGGEGTREEIMRE